MKNIFTILDYKTLLQLNVASVIITGICEIFALLLLFTKGFNTETAPWKLKVMLAIVVVISILLIVSIISLVYFLKNKKK